MANNRLPVETVIRIIALHVDGYGTRAIMRKVGISDTPVRKYVRMFKEAGVGQSSS